MTLNMHRHGLEQIILRMPELPEYIHRDGD